MSEDDRQPGADDSQPIADATAGSPARGDARRTTRRALMMGAASASAVVTIRPALANTAVSVMNCQIPVPDPRLGAGKWIDPRGNVVDAGTRGAFRGPYRPLTAQEVRQAMGGRNFPGADYDQSRAYMAYIRKLQDGMSGFTCYQSLQMPRP